MDAQTEASSEQDTKVQAFDFNEYLKGCYPEGEYEVELLTGGLVNMTIRAESAGKNPGPGLILKHAPPYVAQIGPVMPFSQDRQVPSSPIPSASSRTDRATEN
jgi:hypothetical protein